MRRWLPVFLVLLCGLNPARADDIWDDLDSALSYSGDHDQVRAHLSGTFDLEQYSFHGPAPGFIFADDHQLTNPRLTLFLDTQIGAHVYGFVQFRADQGFDPADGRIRGRFDEYAIRFTPWDDGRLSLQIGKFGAVIGNWIRRHGSWTDPFITAPLPYDNFTGIWNGTPLRSAADLIGVSYTWSNYYPGSAVYNPSKPLPIIWGPSYTEGFALSSKLGLFDLAAEIKSASLSSPPGEWSENNSQWSRPTFNAELSYKPSPMWNVGLSASSGSYLLSDVPPAPGYSLNSYRENVLGQDFEFAWHHLQIWAEAYEARFQVPLVGNANALGYYVETKYKFTTQFSAAIRWNQETYGDIFVPGVGNMRWARDTWRIDVAPSYRLTPYTQIKLQYSLQKGQVEEVRYQQLLALQFTQRF